MKYYVIFGPPGAGKGTQSVPLKRDFNLCHISTGELLRAEIAEGTELGKKANELISAGNFVPDEVVEAMIARKFDTVKDVNGFLLDGFPRTLSQAEDLDKLLAGRGEEVTAILSLDIPEEVTRKRIKSRALIEGRKDDASDEVVTNRIKTYHEKTEPLIDFYKAKGIYHEIDGYGGEGPDGKEIVYARIKAVVEKIEA
mgnify:CR=1 FL=1